MSFCSKCGAKIAKGATFCAKCGGKVGSENKQKEEKKLEPKPVQSEAKPTQTESPAVVPAQTTQAPASQEKGKTNWGLTCGCLGCGGITLIIIIILVILGLAFLGAKGQPGSIIKPSSIKTPKDLIASAQDSSIGLAWKKSGSSDVTKYNVYRSIKAGGDFQLVQTSEITTNLSYLDSGVEKGITYYYVVTAVSSGGTESGNSNQALYALESAPLLPNGVQTWQDVLTKYDADSKYASLFNEITGLTRPDIERYITLQSQGKALKKKLSKGTVIVNTSENYKILYNYTLLSDKWFLTDEKGIPRVMVWCGNPIKLIHEKVFTETIVEIIQDVTYNIIYVFPVSVTNTIIYASNPVAGGFVDIFGDDSIFGPGYYQPENQQDYPETSTSTPTSTATSDLQEGQQWAVEGQLLVEANPHDPAPGESVTMTISLIPAESGVDVEYSVSGTDGYSDSGSAQTDAQGQIQFNIPGGAGGIADTINITVPSKGLEGSTSYTF